MTTTIARSEAETNLRRLLERVRAGDRFVITEEGTAVAELVPVARELRNSKESAVDLLAEFRALRKRTTPASAADIKQWTNEGRP
jgi:antitoxin (DNA-binding transcriptional repressor) of toxin-antitoxin stability system